MSTAQALGAAIDTGRVADRLWLYSNYHCNLRCSYCMPASAPEVPRRILAPEQMVEAADQARALGFRSLGSARRTAGDGPGLARLGGAGCQ